MDDPPPLPVPEEAQDNTPQATDQPDISTAGAVAAPAAEPQSDPSADAAIVDTFLAPATQKNDENTVNGFLHDSAPDFSRKWIDEYKTGQHPEASDDTLKFHTKVAQDGVGAWESLGHGIQYLWGNKTQTLKDIGSMLAKGYGGIQAAAKEETEPTAQLIRDMQDGHPMDALWNFGLNSFKSGKEVTEGAARGVAGLGTAALGGVSELYQLGLEPYFKMFGSKESEQNFGTFLNAPVYQSENLLNRAFDRVAAVSNTDKDSPLYSLAENVAPLAVPLGGEEAGALKLGEATDKIINSGQRILGKTMEGAAKTGPTVSAGVGMAAFAHGHPVIGTELMVPLAQQLAGKEYLKNSYGIGRLISGTINAPFNVLDRAGEFLATKPDGYNILGWMKAGVDDEADRMATKLDRLKDRFGNKLDDAFEKDANGDFVFDADELDKNQLKVRQAQTKLEQLQAKSGRLDNYQGIYNVFSATARSGIKAAVDTLAAGGVGAAFGASTEAPGEYESARQGQAAGMAIGLAARAPQIPVMIRGEIRNFNGADLIRRGERSLPPDNQFYADHQAAMDSLPDPAKNYVNLYSGLADANGNKVVILPSDRFSQLQGVDASKAPNGFYQDGTAFINADALAGGPVPHEVTHALVEAGGLLNDGHPVNTALDAMLKDPRFQPEIDKAKETYTNRMRKTDPNYQLSDADLKSEILADLGSDIIQQQTPQGLYGGRSPLQKAGQFVRSFLNSRPTTTSVFGWPVTPELRNAMADALFQAGEKASQRLEPQDRAPKGQVADFQARQDAIDAINSLNKNTSKKVRAQVASQVDEAVRRMQAEGRAITPQSIIAETQRGPSITRPPVRPVSSAPAPAAPAAVNEPTQPPAQPNRIEGPALVTPQGVEKGAIGETHADLMNKAVAAGNETAIDALGDKSNHAFHDTQGELHDREAAARIAQGAGQVASDVTRLQSEDLGAQGSTATPPVEAAPKVSQQVVDFALQRDPEVASMMTKEEVTELHRAIDKGDIKNDGDFENYIEKRTQGARGEALKALKTMQDTGEKYEVVYTGKDMEPRSRQVQFGVKKGLKGGKKSTAGNPDLYTVYDHTADPPGYRTLNINRIQKISGEGVDYRYSKKYMPGEEKNPYDELPSKGRDVLGRNIPDWRNAPVYHTTTPAHAKNILENGFQVSGRDDQAGYYGHAISVTPDPVYSRNFGDTTVLSRVEPQAKILNLNDPTDWDTFISTVGQSGIHEYRSKITKAGYDGVYDVGAGDLFIYNPDVLKPIRSVDVDTKTGEVSFMPKDDKFRGGVESRNTEKPEQHREYRSAIRGTPSESDASPPKEFSEKLVSPAIRVNDLQFTGKTIEEARAKAKAFGLSPSEIKQGEQGFVTNKGVWKTPDQAGEFTSERRQMGKQQSEGPLSVQAFNRWRRYMPREFSEREKETISKARSAIDQAPKFPDRNQSSAIARDIIYGRLPEDAVSWPVVDVIGTTVLRGGGESTSWHGFKTIRLNGKQIWRGESAYHDPSEILQHLFGDRLVKASSFNRGERYVLKPDTEGKQFMPQSDLPEGNLRKDQSETEPLGSLAIDATAPAWIQRTQELLNKDGLATSDPKNNKPLSDKEQTELDQLQQRGEKEYGSFDKFYRAIGGKPKAAKDLFKFMPGKYDDELRQSLGVSRESLDAYDPQQSAYKVRNKWAVKTVSGGDFPHLYDSKKEAIQVAIDHKQLKEAQFENPSGYRDITMDRASRRLALIRKYQSEGMTEMEAGKQAREDIPDPDVHFMPSSQSFYSQLERTIENQPDKASPEQLRAAILKGPGIKQAELRETKDALGTPFDQWLKDNPKATKQQMLDFVRENQVQVKEINRSGEADDSDIHIREFRGERAALTDDEGNIQEGGYQTVFSAGHDTFDVIIDKDAGNVSVKDQNTGEWLEVPGEMNNQDESDAYDAIRAYIEKNRDLGGTARFSQWQLPGGKNYGETAVTLPEKTVPSDTVVALVVRRDVPGNIPIKSEVIPISEKDSFLKKETRPGVEVLFRDMAPYSRDNYRVPTGHEMGGEADVNRILHLRHNERTIQGPPIERVVKHNPELTRPWTVHVGDEKQHQMSFKTRAEAEAEVAKSPLFKNNQQKMFFLEELQSDWAQKGRKEGYSKPQPTQEQIDAGEAQIEIINQDLSRWAKAIDSAKNSAEKSIARQNYDSAMQQRESIRRDIMGQSGVPDLPFKSNWKQLGLKIALRKAVESGADSLGWTSGEQQAERYDLSKQIDKIGWAERKDGTFSLTIYKDGNDISDAINIPESLPKEKLADYVGKDVAEKIINHEGGNDVAKAGGKWSHIGTLSGVDLKVGGQGMAGFYDRELVNLGNDLVKKWGVKVGESKIATDPKGEIFQDASSHQWFIEIDGKMDTNRTFKTEAEARQAMNEGATVHSLPITDSMRRDILEKGQPLFQPASASNRSSTGDITRTIEGARSPKAASRPAPVVQPDKKKKKTSKRYSAFAELP